MGGYAFVENGRNTARSYNCHVDQHGEVCGYAIDQLAAYENIGLEPGEIKELLRHRYELIAEIGGEEGAEIENKPLTLDELTKMAQEQVAVWIMGEYRYEEPVQGLLCMHSFLGEKPKRPCVFDARVEGRYDPCYPEAVDSMLAEGINFYRHKPIVVVEESDIWAL